MSDKTLEVEGRCPLCSVSSWPGIVMQDYAKNLICDFKRYNFRYRFYYCHRHGIYVWRGSKHELFGLSKKMNQAINVEPLEPEIIKRFIQSKSRMPTLSDYLIVKMKCPYCEGEWEQYDKTWTTQSEAIICPFCHAEIPKEKAKKQ